MYSLPAKAFTELIGTFFLVLTIGLTTELGTLQPIAVGSVLMAVIYAGGHISAAHYNPAVTLAFRQRRRCAPSEVLPYVGAQLAGAVLAALATGLLGGPALGSPPVAAPFEIAPVLAAEVLFTFALCWVILNVAIAKGTVGNPFYGFAIAAVVVAGIYAAGPISGGVFNPAVSVALCLLGLAEWGAIWIYVLAQVVGALAAAVTFGALIESSAVGD